MGSIISYTGWHTLETGIEEEIFDFYDPSKPETKPDSTDLYLHNALVISGYIPGLGILWAGVQIAAAIGVKILPKDTRVYFAIRGPITAVGLGAAFLIPD